MSLHLACAIPGRIATVLEDFLPAELDLIDTSMADGITTPDIVAYHQWEQELRTELPACIVRAVSTTQSEPMAVHPDGFGARVYAWHRFDVMFRVARADAGAAGSDSALGVQQLLMRYVAGSLRVLCIMKPQLETSADPVAFCTQVRWAGSATYGPEPGEGDGSVSRTAILPIEVRLIENR